MTNEFGAVPDFPPSILDEEKLADAYSCPKPFSETTAEEALALLDWRFTRTQAEMAILFERLGLTPLQALVIMDAIEEHQQEIDACFRASWSVPETVTGMPHPLSETMTEVLRDVSESLECKLDEDERQDLMEHNIGLLGLAGMSEEHIIHELNRIKTGPETSDQ